MGPRQVFQRREDIRQRAVWPGQGGTGASPCQDHGSSEQEMQLVMVFAAVERPPQGRGQRPGAAVEVLTGRPTKQAMNRVDV